MDNVTWGAAPSQRTKKEEKYTTAVLTMSALTQVGAGRKFSFNKAAQELLGLSKESNVVFGYSTVDNKVFLKKNDKGLRLTSKFTFSDKKTFEAITKRFNLSNEVENEFDIVEFESYFELVLHSDLENVNEEENTQSFSEEVIDLRESANEELVDQGTDTDLEDNWK